MAHFDSGDAVTVLSAAGREIARGLVVYDSHEARRLMGLHSNELEAQLGYQGRDELIHRDNLVLINNTPGKTRI